MTGNDEEVVIVGGGARGVVLRGGLEGLVDDTPPGAPLLQGLTFTPEGTLVVAGAGAYAARQGKDDDWQTLDLGFGDGDTPASIHALWHDGDKGLYAVGGGVLSPALDDGVAIVSHETTAYVPPEPPPPPSTCPVDAVDPEPTGSIARPARAT